MRANFEVAAVASKAILDTFGRNAYIECLFYLSVNPRTIQNDPALRRVFAGIV